MKKAICTMLIVSIVLANLPVGMALAEPNNSQSSSKDEVVIRTIPFPNLDVLAKGIDYVGRFFTLVEIARLLQEAIVV